MRRLPLLAVAALLLAAGILLGMRMPAPSGGLLLCTLAVALSAAGMMRPAPRLALAAALTAGAALGFVTRVGAPKGCVAGLRDGQRVVLGGTLAAAPLQDATAPFLVVSRQVDGARVRCRGTVRVRAGDRDVVLPAAGRPARLEGRWFATPADGPWPRPSTRAGVLLVDGAGASGDHRLAHPLVRARSRLQGRIRATFGDRAPMAEALLLARKEGLDAATRDRFARAGLSHVLAISGLHVGIIFGLVLTLGVLLRVPRQRALLASASLALAYVMFLGAPHSASRAALMILLFTGARLLQRPTDPLALLAAAAMAILVRDPAAVLDAGFQLSFAGTVGIVVLRRPLDALVRGRLPRWLRNGLVASVAATLATAPVAALHFSRVAPVGILANIVGIPLVGLAVPATALAAVAGSVWLPAGSFLAGGAGVFLRLLDGVARVAAAVPAGHAAVPRGVALALAVLAAAVLLGARRMVHMTQRRWALIGATCVVLVTGPSALVPDGTMELHVVDVGQGDAIAIRSPRGRWVLVDAGPRSERFDAGRARVVPYLLRHGTRRLEALILTHPDGDHIGGAESVLAMLDVRALLDPGLATGKPAYLDLLDRAEGAHRAWFAARAGRRLELDGVVLEVLHPRDVHLDVNESANDVSVVLKVVYGRFSALLLGDAPISVEEGLIDRYGAGMDVDVVKVGHHGSLTSTSRALLDATTPELALISVGRRNRYGHPARAVLERLNVAAVRVLRTDRNGSIMVRADTDGRIEVHTDR